MKKTIVIVRHYVDIAKLKGVKTLSKEINVIVKVIGTEKYCVEAENLEEAKKILQNGDNTKYDLVEQDLDFVEETFREY